LKAILAKASMSVKGCRNIRAVMQEHQSSDAGRPMHEREKAEL
jgi:hypothetical protein